ncbi:MAG: Asp/Glu racemase [Geminicoccaceae bacterium]|nr:MAG: Asp/Glu racemase [Geminicoccaceae bacterium]
MKPERRQRIALIVPSSNTVMENDLHRHLPADRYTVHTARMYLVETTRAAELAMIEDHAPKAASDLGTLRPDLLVFGCTSGGSLFGAAYDQRICDELGERAGCPALGTLSAVNEALARHDFQRLAVLTPYNDDLTTAVAGAVTTETRRVVAAHGLGIEDNVALAEPTPADILTFAEARLRGVDCDGLFVSCTNFRALEARDALAARLGVPVVTSNSAVVDAIRLRLG